MTEFMASGVPVAPSSGALYTLAAGWVTARPRLISVTITLKRKQTANRCSIYLQFMRENVALSSMVVRKWQNVWQKWLVGAGSVEVY